MSIKLQVEECPALLQMMMRAAAVCWWMALLCVLLALPYVARGQAADSLAADSSDVRALGVPFRSAHYTQQDYGHHPQNWEVVQDARGIVYVANANGILEYDGVEWRLIPTATSTFVRSLDIGPDGTVYVGVQGDLGYLAPDSVGKMEYVSLADRVTRRNRDFNDIWNTHATPEGVYFQARGHLFRWKDQKMQTWTTSNGFHTSFAVRGNLYINESGRGLHQMVGDSLQRVPGGEQFSGLGIHAMVPYGDGRTLIGTRKGLFVQGETSITPIETEADPFLESGRLYSGAALPGGHVALSFLGTGVIIIDRQGRLVRVLGPNSELPDGIVNDVHVAEGMLWMAFNNSGMMRAGASSPLTVYDERTGLNGSIYHIRRHAGTLYAATGSGLYYLDEAPLTAEARQAGRRSSFHQVPGLVQTWDLVTVNENLLAATDDGVYEVRRKQRKQITKSTTFALEKSTRRANVLYAGFKEGLMILQRGVGGWTEQRMPGIEDEIRSLHEDDEGMLWLGTVGGDVLRVRFPEDLDAEPQITRFGMDDGLPGRLLRITSVGGELLFYSKEAVLRLRRPAETGAEVFVRDASMLPAAPDSTHGPLLSMVEGAQDDLWMLYQNRLDIAARGPGGSFDVYTPPSLYFPKQEPTPMYVEDGGVAWIGNGTQLLRYDRSAPPMQTGDFEVFIREVASAGGDELMFGGAAAQAASVAPLEDRAQIRFTDNDLRFRFAAPLHNTVTPIEYQYVLEGEDKAWSDWGTVTSMTYTNLWEGNYRFRVQARNERGNYTTIASYAFTVLPPWYRTTWAFALYVVGIGLGVLIGLHYRRILKENRLARERAALLVREQEANDLLSRANARLAQANKLKDNFLANTSHELRTPLTAILGFTTVLKEEATSENHREFLGIIEGNGRRLLDTLNALLDIARIRAGMMKGRRDKANVSQATRETMQLLRPLAGQKDLSFDLRLPDEPVYTYFDPDYLDRVLQNVIGNAIKFTEEGGVTVTVTPRGEEVHIRVADTGIGIGEAFLSEMFDEFKQESTGVARTHEGSGLGLAITARLMQMMDGRIEVDSAKDEGSTFTLIVPGYSEQIVERYEAEEQAEGTPGEDAASTEHDGEAYSSQVGDYVD